MNTLSQPVLNALISGAAVSSAGPTGWIRITGNDRVRWLNGMVTNSVQALAPGEGAYAFLLNAQGRIQGDGVLWADAEEILLQTSAEQVSSLIEMLDRFIIMDEVELEDASAQMHGVRLAGAQAASILQSLGIAAPDAANRWNKVNWMSHEVRVESMYAPLVPRVDLWVSSAQVAQELVNTLLSNGAAQASNTDLETLRVLEGTPIFGTDIRDRDLPQETGQMRALHFNKGCYLGQEIVERIRSRGNVHRTFHTFELNGAIPESGTSLEADGKSIGELTSFARVNGRMIALGFIRREVLDRNLPITYPGGTAQPIESPVRFATS
ncbi:MAG: folate-binding protein YgfZ [Acidobacteria bacterium]|nr:folate-binding protein YgfZ [Acidobacteriota bacterium]